MKHDKAIELIDHQIEVLELCLKADLWAKGVSKEKEHAAHAKWNAEIKELKASRDLLYSDY